LECPQIDDIEIAVGLSVGLLEYHGTDVVADGTTVDVGEEVVDEHGDGFAAFEEVDLEGGGQSGVLLEFGDALLEQPGVLG
jgi:hypothetical protein